MVLFLYQGWETDASPTHYWRQPLPCLSREPPRTYGKPQRPFTALLTVTLEQKSTAHGIPFLQSKSEALSVQRILCRVLSNSITQTMSHARTLLLPHQNRWFNDLIIHLLLSIVPSSNLPVSLKRTQTIYGLACAGNQASSLIQLSSSSGLT